MTVNGSMIIPGYARMVCIFYVGFVCVSTCLHTCVWPRPQKCPCDVASTAGTEENKKLIPLGLYLLRLIGTGQ